MSLRQRSAFTLVELLVVIGIIALMISILLPALNRARQSANLVACQSNLRQIGQACQLYAAQNGGFLPWGESPPDAGNGNRRYPFSETLSALLSGWKRPTTPPTSPIFRDFDTLTEWHGRNDLNHYMANIRMFGGSWDSDASYTPSIPARPRKAASIRQASQRAAIWCSNQILNNNGKAFPVNSRMDHWRYYDTGFYFVAGLNPAKENELLTNASAMRGEMASVGSASPLLPSMRTRHMNNTTANLVFADGHVEGRKQGEIYRRLFVVNK